MREKKTQDTGDRGQDTGHGTWSRRGWMGAVAGAVAAVAGLRRKRPETVAEKRRRKRFWIGHT